MHFVTVIFDFPSHFYFSVMPSPFSAASALFSTKPLQPNCPSLTVSRRPVHRIPSNLSYLRVCGGADPAPARIRLDKQDYRFFSVFKQKKNPSLMKKTY